MFQGPDILVLYMEIILPERVRRKIIEESEKRGVDPEEFIAEIIIDRLSQDPKDRVELYIQLCEKYLKDAEEMLRKGDHIQASEKMWDAAATFVKAVALKLKGSRLTSHGELWEFVDELSKEMKDDEVRRLWRTAISMHINFYEKWAPLEDVEHALKDIKTLINKLRKFAGL